MNDEKLIINNVSNMEMPFFGENTLKGDRNGYEVSMQIYEARCCDPES